MKKSIIAFIGLFFWVSSFYSQTKKWSIQDCIQYAIDHNIDVKQQLLNLEEAKLTTSSAKGAYLPNLNASVRNTWNNGLSQNVVSGNLVKSVETIRNSSYGVNSNIPIFNGLINYNNLQQARLQEIAAQFNIESIKDDIKLNVANSYLQVLLQKENIAILKAQYQLSVEQLNRAKELVSAGNIPKGDLLQLQATIANDEQNIAQAENSYVIAKLGLKRLLNLNLSEEIEVKKENVSLIEMKVLETPIDSILKTVLSNRNEIKLSKSNIEVAKKGVDIAKGSYLPTLSGFVNFDTREIDKSTDSYFYQLENNYGFTYGLSLNIPIFNGFKIKNSVAKNKLNVLRREHQLEQTKQMVIQNVHQAYLNAKASYKTYISSQKTVEAQELAFQYQQTKFDVGESNLLDYTQNKILYQNSQTDLLRTKYDLLFRLKIIELYYTLSY
ncbi:outer membrane protein [Wenyingzhuangia heitensis]|uniref:Outer membrane protein n=1 Tax=Wenyingzhuangia heitensis TaxID=1487859 RepID=A0ABX0UBB5_9FLAO|nr:TolC family protein [Wenyingzhuangia heitensis]NIJ45588.1 outer membrane protein [Wenyingzhuangia heitensis]